MAPSATSSPAFGFNFKPLLRKTGSSSSLPQISLDCWLPSSIELFDFSPDSSQPVPIRPNQPAISPNLSLIETEPWTPPPDAHPEISLHAFVAQAWRILEPAVPFVDSWHLGLLCGHLEAISTGRLLEPNLLVNTPPGSSKSLIASVLWPAWVWTWAPWIRWLTSSFDDALALRDAWRTRRLMNSGWYRRQITEPWEFVGDQNVKGNYVNDKTGWRIATSIKGEITGNHAHVVMVDDPHHVKKVESDAEREATLTIWREVFPSRVLPGGTRVMVGQRTHEEDATADWLSREGQDIHHIELKMEYEAPRAETRHPKGHVLTEGDQSSPRHGAVCTLTGEPHDQRTYEGDLLIPERFPRAVIERRKIELGPYAFSAQFQQSPTPRAGALLNPAWFPQTRQLERSTVDLVAAFDLNYSDADTSDWTVGLLGAVERTPVLPRIHLIAGFAEHLSEARHVEHIGEWLCLWRPILVGIEKRAFEKQGATRDLCRQLLEYCEERGFSLSLEPIECDGDKISRAMIIPGRAKAGLITADKRAPFWTRLSKEMSTFPRSQHDDACLVGETLVTTRQGPRRIDEVRVGDEVAGLSGWVRVEVAMQTGVKPVATYGPLRGTANHPVWTDTGWREISQLSHTMNVWTLCVQCRTASAQSWQSGSAECITNDSTDQVWSAPPHPIETCPGQLVPWRDVIEWSTREGCAVSTTRDGSDTVIRSPFSALSEVACESKRSSSTESCFDGIPTAETSRIARTSSQVDSTSSVECRRSTKRFGSPTMGLSLMGTMSTIGTVTRRIIQSATSSYSTLSNMPASTPQSGANGAVPISSLSTWLVSEYPQVRGIGPRQAESGIGNTRSPWLSGNSDVEPVYNLKTTDGTYFANGVLVHNCDALAHLVRLVVEKLERLRNLGGLLGKSAQVVVEDSVDDARPDWAKAAMAGLR